MIEDQLKDEFDFYLKNQNELVKQYENKFIVIKNKEIIGVYDTKIDAYESSKDEHELGTFLIQLVEKGEDNYSQTFYSRVL